MLLADLLPSLPWLEAAAATSGADLGALVDLNGALGELGAAVGLMLRGSRDGALVAAELALVLCDQAQEALGAATDDESRALRQRLSGATQGLDRAEEDRDALLQRTARTIVHIEAEAAAAEAQQRYERVLDQVTTDRDVAPEDLSAAVAYKRQKEQAAALSQAARRSRKLPRT